MLNEEWNIYQSRSRNGYWKTKVMRGPWHVTTIVTITKRGGNRSADKLIKKRQNDYN